MMLGGGKRHHQHASLLLLTAVVMFSTAADAAIPGEKLLDTANYGRDEYFILVLASFIGFVVIKHLIFHTMYFWWYTNGRFHIPNFFWSIITGKNLCERIYSHVVTNMNDDVTTISKTEQVLQSIEDYCENGEFAANFGPHKGELLTLTLKEKQPRNVLMIGSSYGYVMTTIMQMMPTTSHDDDVILHVIDEDVKNVAHLTKLAKLLGVKVNLICKPTCSVLTHPRDHFGSDVINFDFIFTTRKSHDQPSHADVIKLMETNKLIADGSVIFADKVVFFTDPQYLMYVRESSNYNNKYHQMALEHNIYDILDGIEISQFTTNATK